MRAPGEAGGGGGVGHTSVILMRGGGEREWEMVREGERGWSERGGGGLRDWEAGCERRAAVRPLERLLLSC